jgi:hypothetical protein
MAEETTVPTQVKHSWRATVRTVFQGVVGFAALAPAIYQAIEHKDASAATGFAAIALAVSGALTKVMAIPAVNDFIAKYLPFLAAESK